MALKTDAYGVTALTHLDTHFGVSCLISSLKTYDVEHSAANNLSRKTDE